MQTTVLRKDQLTFFFFICPEKKFVFQEKMFSFAKIIEKARIIERI